MKNLFLKKEDWSDAQYDLVASDQDIRQANTLLYRNFDGMDKKHSYDGNPKEESKQLCRELFSLLYYNHSKKEDRPKQWAKSSFEKIEASMGFNKLKDKCFLNVERAKEATAILIKSLAGEISELRKSQKEYVKENEYLGIPQDELEDDFIPESDDLENLADKLAKIPSEIIDDFEASDQIGKMLGLAAGNNDDDLTTDKSVSRQLVNDIKRNKKIRDIFLKAGALLSAMDDKKVKDQSTIENMIGTKQGRDLALLTPSSRNLLLNPITETLFYDKFCRNLLDVFEYEAETNKSRGPIWVLLDRSSSTHDSQRYVIINAISIAFIHLAKKQKRPIWLVEFNSVVKSIYSMDTKIECIKDNKSISFENMICDLAKRLPSGGTNFDAPINCALDKDPKAKKADLVMITDGNANLSKETGDRINSFKDDGMKLYTILLGQNTSSLEPYSDIMVDLESLQNQDKEIAVGSIMNSVRD